MNGGLRMVLRGPRRAAALACLCLLPAARQAVCAEVGPAPPPLARVRKIAAHTVAEGIAVAWETAYERDLIGFYLDRRSAREAESVRITARLLPGLPAEPAGGSYRYVDTTAAPGRQYTYTLIAVSLHGREEQIGHVAARSGATARRSPLPAQEPVYTRRSQPPSAAQAARTAVTAAEARAARLKQEARVGPRLKIAVEDTGVYRLDAGVVAARTGLSSNDVTSRIAARGWRLSMDGQRVAWVPAEDGRGIYFFNRRPDSLYTESNIFWLEQGNGIVVPPLEGTPPAQPGPPGQGFTETLAFEQDLAAATGVFRDPETDYWLWTYVSSGGHDTNFPFRLQGVAAGTHTARLTIRLQPGSNTGLPGEHHAVFAVNGTAIEQEAVWQGLTGAVCTLYFDQSILSNGVNELRMAGVLDAGIPYSYIYADSFEVTYCRSYEVTGDRILFDGGTNATATLRGFTAEPVHVLDITDETRPRLVLATSVSRSNANVSVTLSPSAGARYAAFTPAAARAPASVWADVPSSLRSATNRGNYVVITDARFADRVQRLRAYRQSNGWETVQVLLEDIYDEFSRGSPTPHAVRRFLRHAYRSWQTPPTHVLLAGEGTYDYRNLTGHGDCIVPVLMWDTPYRLFAADTLFGDIEGKDGVPEIAIGRLPAATGAELDTMIDKTLAYETAAGGAWTQAVVMAADNSDDGGNYPVDSDAAAALLPPNLSVQKIYLSDLETEEAREHMTNAIHDGTALLHYIGHCGQFLLATEGLLTTTDVRQLTNANHLTVAVGITCFLNRFEVPGYDYLGEELLLRPGGGAVCVWGPSGLSVNSLGRTLDQAFLRARYVSGQRVIGDVVKSALQGYGASGQSRFMLDIYNLLGDPATVMK